SLRQRINRAKKNQQGFSGFFDSTVGGIAEIVTGGEVRHDKQSDVIAKAEAELRELEKAMAKGGKAGTKSAEALDRTAVAAERAARALASLVPPGSGGDGTNGLPGAPGNLPGSMPR